MSHNTQKSITDQLKYINRLVDILTVEYDPKIKKKYIEDIKNKKITSYNKINIKLFEDKDIFLTFFATYQDPNNFFVPGSLRTNEIFKELFKINKESAIKLISYFYNDFNIEENIEIIKLMIENNEFTILSKIDTEKYKELVIELININPKCFHCLTYFRLDKDVVHALLNKIK